MDVNLGLLRQADVALQISKNLSTTNKGPDGAVLPSSKSTNYPTTWCSNARINSDSKDRDFQNIHNMLRNQKLPYGHVHTFASFHWVKWN